MKKLLFILLGLSNLCLAGELQDTKLWAINEKTHEIPLYKEPNTGFIDINVETIISLANSKYNTEDRQQIIDYCRQDSIKRFAGGDLVKNYSPGIMDHLKREFQICSVGMIKQWEAEE